MVNTSNNMPMGIAILGYSALALFCAWHVIRVWRVRKTCAAFHWMYRWGIFAGIIAGGFFRTVEVSLYLSEGLPAAPPKSVLVLSYFGTTGFWTVAMLLAMMFAELWITHRAYDTKQFSHRRWRYIVRCSILGTSYTFCAVFLYAKNLLNMDAGLSVRMRRLITGAGTAMYCAMASAMVLELVVIVLLQRKRVRSFTGQKMLLRFGSLLIVQIFALYLRGAWQFIQSISGNNWFHAVAFSYVCEIFPGFVVTVILSRSVRHAVSHRQKSTGAKLPGSQISGLSSPFLKNSGTTLQSSGDSESLTDDGDGSSHLLSPMPQTYVPYASYTPPVLPVSNV